MTKEERELVRRLAESYAFIADLRQVAINRGDTVYVQKTQGINSSVQTLRERYPKVFQRYFQAATKRVQELKEGNKQV